MTRRPLNALLAELRRLDVKLFVQGDRLRCDAPKGALTPALQTELRTRKVELLEFLRSVKKSTLRVPPVRPASAVDRTPLSFAQEGAWFIDQLQPGVAFNIVWPMRLVGRLDISSLKRTIQEIVRRHDVLRTNFVAPSGQPHQVVRTPGPVELNHVNLEDLPSQQRSGELLEQVIRLAQLPFDMATEPLTRWTLFRLNEQDHLLLFVVHHAVFDGWSLKVFAHEFSTLYGAYLSVQPSPLPALPVQYSDYCVWQRELLTGPYYEAQVDYWKQQLADVPASLGLPTDRRPSSAQLFEGDVVRRTLTPALGRALRTLSQTEGVTMFMLLLAAFKTVLMRYSGQEDVVVGTPVANRNQQEMAGVIGFCVNLLALRGDLTGNPSFRTLLERERAVCLQAYDHQELPFGKLVQELQTTRDIGNSPLFQVQFALHEVQNYELTLPGLKLNSTLDSDDLSEQLLTRIANAQPATDHLFLNVLDTGSEFSLVMHSRRDLFEEASVQRMLVHVERVLEQIAINPDQALWDIELVSPTERKEITHQWSGAAPTSNAHSNAHSAAVHPMLPDRITDWAKRAPDAIAVCVPAELSESGQPEEMTYGALEQQSNQLAHYLVDSGVQPEDRIGICLKRSTQLIVAVLAVMKTGASFVPLDPGYGENRLSYLVEQAAISRLITHTTTSASSFQLAAPFVYVDELCDVIQQQPTSPVSVRLDQRQLAYVVYTSGSTGHPKGVMVSHGSLANAYAAWEKIYELDQLTCHLQMASFSFDVFIGDFARALGSGSRLILCPREKLLVPQELWQLLQDYEVDCAEFVPAVIRMLLDYLEPRDEELNSLKLVLVGSDYWDVAEYQRLKNRLTPTARLLNSYGIAEATIDSTYFEDADGDLTEDGPLPIGKPFPGSEIYVLDRRLQLAPIGVPGELYLGGAGLGRGYLDRAGMTAERFVPHPFSATPGRRLYRTGDRVRLLPDGNLEFLGRVDHQVKIRGFRIEPGEVEATLCRHPLVQNAVVLAHAEAGGEKRLVAYVEVGVETDAPDETELRDFLSARLPAHMVPSQFITLPTFPLTPNGKVDRRALPAPSLRKTGGAEYTGPRTLTELDLCRIWSEVLAVERVGIHDNFFALGGHSLLAARLIARLREELEIELPLRSLFEHPSVAAMAGAVEQARRSSDSLLPPIEKIDSRQQLPLSYAQEGAWFVDQMQPGIPFNIPLAFRLHGPLQESLVLESFRDLVHRHESLRTHFSAVDGQPYQVVRDEIELPFQIVDLESLEPRERERELVRGLIQAVQIPFDLAEGPLVRLTLFRLDDSDHVILLNAHHIVFDGHSVALFARDFAACYEARRTRTTADLPELTVQYADYAVWNRKVLAGEFLDSQVEYWRNQLADYPTGLDLATSRRRTDNTLFHGDTVSHPLSADLTESLREICHREGVTMFMLLLASFKALLARYSGQEDLIVGTPVATRNHREMADVIGFCVNVLALRTDLSGDPTFTELLERVRDVCIEGYSHQEVPFGLLVQKLKPDRHVQNSPFFQVAFAMQNTSEATPLELPGGLRLSMELDLDIARRELASLTMDVTPATDHLFLQVIDSGKELTAVMHHRSDLFDAGMIRQMMEHFQRLLEQVSETPDKRLSRLDLALDEERDRCLRVWNDTASPLPEHRRRCIHEQFALQVRRTPDATAMEYPAEDNQAAVHWTYDELNRRSNQVAHRLIEMGLRPDCRVAIYVDRSPQMFSAVLGILKAGGAYVPIAPDYPRERVQWILQDSRPDAVLTQSPPRGELPETAVPVMDLDDSSWQSYAQTDPAIEVHPANAAYLIYTSGSSSEPKGVVTTHEGVVNHNLAVIEHFGLTPADRVLQFHSTSFDAAVEEMFPTWLSGGTLVVRGKELIMPGHDLARWIDEFRLSVLNLPTAYWHEWVNALRSETYRLPESLRLVIVGGDKASTEDWEKWDEWTGSKVRWLNTYGPTETTVISTLDETSRTLAKRGPHAQGPHNRGPDARGWDDQEFAELESDELELTIGRPIANTRAYILDRYLNPVPVGVAGELYLAGAGLARGYHDRPGLTAEQFVPDPFGSELGGSEGGGRLYRTGDRVRYLQDGRIEFLGRIDQQVKIRGFRVEPGEVVNALRTHPEIQDAYVRAHGQTAGGKKLIAYVVTPTPESFDTAAVRAYLCERLPEPFVPALILALDDFPRTSGGKWIVVLCRTRVV